MRFSRRRCPCACMTGTKRDTRSNLIVSAADGLVQEPIRYTYTSTIYVYIYITHYWPLVCWRGKKKTDLNKIKI